MNKRRRVIDELSVQPVINAFETVTAYGGSLMPAEVVAAMAEVSNCFVDVRDLNRKAGARIAELTENEAGIVVGGCAAALALSVAAATTGIDPSLVESFPTAATRETEVVVHRGQRNPYDRALRLGGARIVEFGYPTHQASTTQLENAITERTVAVVYFAGAIFQRYALSLSATVAVAHARGVPVIVDGAAQVPPKINLTRYTKAGADVALFSVGKGIRGPQEAGLVLGKSDMVRAIEMHASPNQSFGRPMKVSKESIVGTLRAVELLMERDEAAEYAEMKRIATEFMGRLSRSVGIETRLLPSGRHGQFYPRVAVAFRYYPEITRNGSIEALAAGEPAIIVGPSDDDPGAFCVNFFALTEEESVVVADRILHLAGANGPR